MVESKPFIHLIKTPYGFYIFDVNTNSLLETNEDIYNYLHKKQKGFKLSEKEQSKEIISQIGNMENNGLLSEFRPKEIIHPEDEFLEYRLNNKIRKITLQVTQKCNFKCRYCIYSESDNDLQRKHSTKQMSFETAKKGIDFLISHSKDTKKINIGFYGGEPLLEFEFIKKCIEYAKTVCRGKDISFNITTNGTLLNPEIIHFFKQHNVQMLISLDGPKEVHDKNRRFASNGCGTFEQVENNLKQVKEKFPDYYQKIMFSVVIDPQNDLSCTNEYFSNDELVKDRSIISSTLDDRYSNEKVSFSGGYIETWNYEYFKVLLSKFGKIDKKYTSSIMNRTYSNLVQLVKNFNRIFRLPDKISHGGPCVPGELRLFIDVEGNFFPCERVSEMSEVMNIGNLNTGFNISKARNILNVASITGEKCKDCWAINHCTLCAAYADNTKELSKEKVSDYCYRVKQDIESNFKYFLALKEIEYYFNYRIIKE